MFFYWQKKIVACCNVFILIILDFLTSFSISKALPVTSYGFSKITIKMMVLNLGSTLVVKDALYDTLFLNDILSASV